MNRRPAPFFGRQTAEIIPFPVQYADAPRLSDDAILAAAEAAYIAAHLRVHVVSFRPLPYPDPVAFDPRTTPVRLLPRLLLGASLGLVFTLAIALTPDALKPWWIAIGFLMTSAMILRFTVFAGGRA